MNNELNDVISDSGDLEDLREESLENVGEEALLGVVAEGKVMVECFIELATLLNLIQHCLNVNCVVHPAEGCLVVACEGLNYQVLEVPIETRRVVLEVGDLEETDFEALEEPTSPLTSVSQICGESGWVSLIKSTGCSMSQGNA